MLPNPDPELGDALYKHVLVADLAGKVRLDNKDECAANALAICNLQAADRMVQVTIINRGSMLDCG